MSELLAKRFGIDLSELDFKCELIHQVTYRKRFENAFKQKKTLSVISEFLQIIFVNVSLRYF